MKRVCIIRHSSYPEVPPTRRNAEALVSHGYEVDVICSRKNGQQSREVIQGVTVYRLPLEHHRRGALRYLYEYLAFFLLASWKLARLSLKRRYQVVEVDAMPDFLIFATLFPKLLGAKVTLNMLDFVPLTYADQFKISPNHILIRVLSLVEMVCMKFADHVILPHGPLREKYFNKGIAYSKTSAVLNVPDESIFHQGATPQKGPEAGYFQLITHGSLLKKYGVQTLIKAVPLLTPHIPELKLSIVGDGEYRPYLEELAQALRVEDYVHFTGFVPMEEVPRLISQADAGVISLLIRMMPTKLFEYIAMGKPVIATDFPSMRSYFNDEAVRYYKPGDEHDLARGVLDLYRNPEKRAKLAASASAVYQKLRWDVMKYEYLKVFDQLTNGKGRGLPEEKLTMSGLSQKK